VICGLGGNDVLVGRGGDDVLRGGGGADRLDGGSADDMVAGGGGADHLIGGDGNDRLVGGASNDTESAGNGRDLVVGGYGNDDLTGGPSGDDVRGGPGTNWCTLDSADIATRCVYDRTPASPDSFSFSTGAVDVTAASRSVTVRVHVSDDTGVEGVRVVPSPDGDPFTTANAMLQSGDIRNGWWQATLVFPRYSIPGTYVPRVSIWDRVGRRSDTDFPGSPLDVRDANPDLELPTVTLLTPAPTATYDARTDDVAFTVKARIVDALSGTASDSLGLTIWQPRVDGVLIAGWGGGMHLVSGTLHDGIWAGRARLPHGVVGGTWNLDITVSDQANLGSGRRADWWGPGEWVYQSQGDTVLNRPFPNNMGSVKILGRARTDSTPPTISSVQLSPASIDTLPGPAQVHFTVQAADAGLGVGLVQVELVPAVSDPTAPMMPVAGVYLVSGTAANGTYSGDMTMPQGFPPGTYYVKLLTADVDDNFATYVSSGLPDPGWIATRLATNPTVTVVDSTP
jgi:hypothetical protein